MEKQALIVSSFNAVSNYEYRRLGAKIHQSLKDERFE